MDLILWKMYGDNPFNISISFSNVIVSVLKQILKEVNASFFNYTSERYKKTNFSYLLQYLCAPLSQFCLILLAILYFHRKKWNPLIRIYKHAASFIICLILGFSALGQESFTFKVLEKESRASFGSVRQVFQDSSGLVWLSVFGKGLHTYNGKKIKRFPLNNEDLFYHRTHMMAYANNRVFLNEGKNIRVFDCNNHTLEDSFNFKDPAVFNEGEIEIIETDELGQNVWALVLLKDKDADPLTSHFYLLKSNNDNVFEVISSQAFTTDKKPILKVNKNGALIKSEESLLFYDNSGELIQSHKIDGNWLSRMTQKNCAFSGRNKLWFTEGIGEENRARQNYKLYCKNIMNGKLDYVTNITIGGDIRIKGFHTPILNCLTLEGEHLYFNNDLRYNIQNGKSTNLMSNTTFDSEDVRGVAPVNSVVDLGGGNIVIGGEQGLATLVSIPQVFDYIPKISNRGFVEDDKGNIYGGTYGRDKSGINIYNPKTNSVNTIPATINWFTGIIDNNTLYFNDFIMDLESNDISRFKNVNDLSVLFHIKNGEGQVWKISQPAVRMSLYDLNTKRLIKQVQLPETKVRTEINGYYQSSFDGSIWLATDGNGIYKYSKEGELLNTYNSNNDNPLHIYNNIASSFYESTSEEIWVGHASGLTLLEFGSNKSSHYFIDENNPDKHIVYGILPEDDDRYLWLTTNLGIFRFDRQEGVFMDFPLNKDVMSNEFNRTSFFKASDGRFYCGHFSPFTSDLAFNPNKVLNFYKSENLNKHKIVLEKLSVYNSKKDQNNIIDFGLNSQDEIVLQPHDRYFSLDYFLTDYRSPEGIFYSHTLKGYENNWSSPSQNGGTIRYDNLAPGDYTLKMKASLVRSMLDLNQREIKIRVLPFWYQKMWVKALFVLALGFLTYFIYRSQLRRQLEKSEALRLKELNDVKSRLYTNITHEFRTPLTVIMGMNDNIKGHRNERGLIKRNAKNLLRLINQLLDLSKLDSGTLKMDKVNGDIVGYLKYLTESFYSMASDKKVSLTFKTSLETQNMDFDEVKIQHIVYNLLSNAIKFTRPGGKVILEVDTDKNHEGGSLKVKVKDTGVGISELELPKIFDRFYQAQNKRKSTSYSGTGIGLALTKELIDLMGGTISVKSELDWGTEFNILLPIKNNIDTPPINNDFAPPIPKSEIAMSFDEIPMKPDHISGNKNHVLIIEDNKGVVEYIKSLLVDQYQVHVAYNGQEGINLALELIPDMIITDVMMPEKNGYEVCAFLKNEIKTSHIPIVMLTAKADIDSKVLGLETGADAYLSKPFEKRELQIRVQKLLEIRKKLIKKYGHDMFIQQEKEITESNRESMFLIQLNGIIEDRYTDPELSIPDLSQLMNMSHTQMYRKLKALTDKSPSQYLRKFRLTKAMDLLKSTEMNISQVAYEVGFNDPNYFTRMFKKEYGKLPGDI